MLEGRWNGQMHLIVVQGLSLLVGGPTGSGKAKVLHDLSRDIMDKHVIDLNGLGKFWIPPEFAASRGHNVPMDNMVML